MLRLPVKNLRIVKLLILSVVFIIEAKASSDWRTSALLLSGASQKTKLKLMNELRSHPHLSADLRRALDGGDRFLALDTIAALQLVDLREDLIRISITDRTGYSYLALDSFVDANTLQETASLYHQRLLQAETSASARVILLDSLSRMNVRLSKSELQSVLFNDTSPEVRSSAVRYLRHRMTADSDERYLGELKKLLTEPTLSVQTLTQAYSLTSELPTKLKVQLNTTRPCPKNVTPILWKICEKARLSSGL